MRVRAFQLVKGATNLSTADTIGIRFGWSFASAHELYVGSGYTSSTVAIYNMVPNVMVFENRKLCSVGNGVPTTLMLLMCLEDYDEDGSLYVRRNAIQMEANRLAITDLGTIYSSPGKMRTAEEMNAIAANSFMEGYKGAMALSESLYE